MERCELARLHTEGHSHPPNRGKHLDSLAILTVARELKIQWLQYPGLPALLCHSVLQALRPAADEAAPGWMAITSCVSRYSPDLARAASPQQVARDAWRHWVFRSHCRSPTESVYRFIYAQIRRTKDYSWLLLPAQGQVQARLAGTQGRQPRLLHCPSPSPLGTAPGGCQPSMEPGHWEADLMLLRQSEIKPCWS